MMWLCVQIEDKKPLLTQEEIDEIKAQFNVPESAIIQSYKVERTAINEPLEHFIAFHWED